MAERGLDVSILSDEVLRHSSLDGSCIGAQPLDMRLPVMEVGLGWLALLTMTRVLTLQGLSGPLLWGARGDARPRVHVT